MVKSERAGESLWIARSGAMLMWAVIIFAAPSFAQEIFIGPKFDPVPIGVKIDRGSTPRAIAVEDLIERRRFLGASISPDGGYFSYAVVQAKIEGDSYSTALMLAKVDQPSRVRVLGSAGRPRWNYVGEYFPEPPQWSPDGKFVAYTVQIRGARQIWRWSVDGGSGEQLTRSALDVFDYRWLPDGSGMIYSTRSHRPNTDEPRDESPVLYKDTTMGWNGPPILDRAQVSSPEIKLWIYRLEDRSSRAATENEIKIYGNEFRSPFQPGAGKDLRLSPDGRVRVELESEGNDKKYTSIANRLVFKDALSGKILVKSETLRTRPTVVGWKPESRTALVSWSPAFGVRGLYEVSAEDGRLRPALPGFSEFLTDCTFTQNVDKALCSHESSVKLPGLTLLDLREHTARTLVDLNPEFRAMRLGKSTPISWTNRYGDEKQGWVILPVDYREGKRYPALITPYHFPGSFLNGLGDEFPLQVFADNGFVVICVHTPPERRRDQGFENALLDFESPASSFEALIKLLAEQTLIDPQRVGIMGLSYGAELTEYAISHSDAFAAAASSTAGGHDPGKIYTLDKMARDSYYGPKIGLPGWWEGDVYAKRWAHYSTLLNAANIRSPWLVQAADQELVRAVPIFNRMDELGKAFEMWAYPDEMHIKNHPRNQSIAQARYLDWFNFWLQGKEDPNPVKQEQYQRWRAMREKLKAGKLEETPNDR